MCVRGGMEWRRGENGAAQMSRIPTPIHRQSVGQIQKAFGPDLARRPLFADP